MMSSNASEGIFTVRGFNVCLLYTSTKEKETQIVEYADWAIGDFLKKASREPWYKNTIFVIQADHGKLVGKLSLIHIFFTLV